MRRRERQPKSREIVAMKEMVRLMYRLGYPEKKRALAAALTILECQELAVIIINHRQ